MTTSKFLSSKFVSAILIMALAWSAPAAYSFAAPQYSEAVPAFSDDELDQMLAPIALYPDPLLAQVLPASTFGYQISQAQQMLGGHVDENLIDSQNWDVSVKAVAHYPDILGMMAENPEWTASLGQAFIMQEPAVAHSIQRLRIVAVHDNVLKTTPQQHVIVVNNVVQIVPARANVIYVPQYDPYSIWGVPAPFETAAVPYGVISFGPGFLIGSWLNRDWDWHGRGPFYHGWKGGGWVGASRQYVNTGNRIYVNNHFYNINVNRAVEQKNTRDFRSRMERNAVARQKPGARPTRPPGEAKAPPAPAPAPAPAPEAKPPAPSAPEREKPTPAPAPSRPAAPGTQERPSRPQAPKAPPAVAPEEKPTPPSAPGRPAAPGTQARPTRPQAPKAPPAAAPEAKPTPPSAPSRPAAPGPQARPSRPSAPQAPSAAAPAPREKPTPPSAPTAGRRSAGSSREARPTSRPEPKAAPAPSANPPGGGAPEED